MNTNQMGVTDRRAFDERKILQEFPAHKPPGPPAPARLLKIEAEGDPWKGAVKSKIRLMGRWLERAGFSPGQHVRVHCVAPGVIELRSPNGLPAFDEKR